MTTEYPKMLFAPTGRGSVTVRDAVEEATHRDAGFSATPGEAHRATTPFHAPDIVPGVALTEAHIPLIVDHVVAALGGTSPGPRTDGAEPLTTGHIGTIVETLFDRLRDMAVAASREPGARAAADAVAALHEGLDERFDALRSELLGEVRALIAPAPTPTAGKTGKA